MNLKNVNNEIISSRIDDVFKGIREECKIMCDSLSELALLNAKRFFGNSILDNIDITIDKMGYDDLDTFYTLLQKTLKNKKNK
jgi:hypothetical protein